MFEGKTQIRGIDYRPYWGVVGFRTVSINRDSFSNERGGEIPKFLEYYCP